MARSDDNRKLRVVSGEGKTNLSKRERFVSFIILGIILLLLISAGYQWVYSWFYYRRVHIAVAEEGSIESVVNVKGIITRHEKVICSPESGFILGRIPEGERVPVGGEVVTILPEYNHENEKQNELEESGFQFYYKILREWGKS